ncbi:MAG: phosphotransferase [Nocardioidaceae bacterium]
MTSGVGASDDWPRRSAVLWVERSLGQRTRVVRSRRLLGGITADIFRLDVSAGTTTDRSVVLRCWPAEAEWGGACVVRETAGLDALVGSGLPVPRMLAAEPTGEVAGNPSTLTTFVAGSVALAPPRLDDWLARLAAMLVRIHRLPPVDLPPCEEGTSAERLELSWLRDPGLAAEARALAAERLDDRQSCLCHGDYQHFNVLWTASRISGVVDWPAAGRGVRGRDVGHCRLNLAVLYSVAAAERFLSLYEREVGGSVDPVADVRELLEFGDGWLGFIPRQVAGRTALDVPGMTSRVRDLVALVLSR